MAARPQGRILKRYRLKGPYAGADCVLCGYLFRAGELEVSLLESEHESLARVLWFYQAEEVTEDGKRDVSTDEARDLGSETRPGGEGVAAGAPGDHDRDGSGQAQGVDEGGRLVSGRDGPQESLDERIRAAVASLDGGTDLHWTSAGKPSLQVVSDAVGITVTRAQVQAAAPGIVRKVPA